MINKLDWTFHLNMTRKLLSPTQSFFQWVENKRRESRIEWDSGEKLLAPTLLSPVCSINYHKLPSAEKDYRYTQIPSWEASNDKEGSFLEGEETAQKERMNWHIILWKRC